MKAAFFPSVRKILTNYSGAVIYVPWPCLHVVYQVPTWEVECSTVSDIHINTEHRRTQWPSFSARNTYEYVYRNISHK
jgi:hypothetical protein